MFKRLCSLFLVLVLCVSLTSVGFAAEVTTDGSDGETQAEVTQAVSTFSVTLPSVLPVAVSSDGTVLVATNAEIRNASYGPVKVSAVQFTAVNGWTLVDSSVVLASEKVGSKKFGFELNSVDVPSTGVADVSVFSSIPGSSSFGFIYDASVAPQATSVSESIANVVFTVGWDKEVVGYEIMSVSDLDTWEDDEGNVSLILDSGMSADLSAVATYSSEAPVWSSSNEGVISISDAGVMTAVAPGYAEITYGTDRVSETIGVWVPDTFEVTSSNRSLVGYTGEENEELIIPKYVLDEDNLVKKVTTISTWSFAMRNNLISVELPDSVECIKAQAFYGCTSLVNVSIPESVVSFGTSAFLDTPYLAAKRVESPLVVVNGTLIDGKTCSGNVVIPGSVSRISAGAFLGCTELLSVVIPDSVIEIGYEAFSSCSKLESVILPAGLITIKGSTFLECTSLTNVVIPDGVLTIESSAFFNCTSLTNVVIPDSVTEICAHAFYGCSSLVITELPSSITSLGNLAFSGCLGSTSLTIPAGLLNIGENPFTWDMLESIIVDESNPVYDSRNNCNAIIETSSGVLVSGCASTVIPDGVTEIGVRAFYSMPRLVQITIPSSVSILGGHAFGGCVSLAVIKYTGSEEQWLAIDKGYSWDFSAGSDTADGTYTVIYDVVE